MALQRPSPPDREPAHRPDPEFAVRLGAEAIGAFALTFVAAGGDVMIARFLHGPVPREEAAEAAMG